MVLYHVSLEVPKNTKSVITEFKPRIPKSTANRENRTIKRVCFAPSVKECISGIENFSDKIGDKILVYKLDTSAYKPKIPSSKILSPDKLANYVGDTSITNEHWILTDLKLIGKVKTIIEFEADYVYLVSDNMKSDIIDYVEDNYSLTRKQLSSLKKYTAFKIVNSILYNFDSVDVSEIADYFNLECADIVSKIKLK